MTWFALFFLAGDVYLQTFAVLPSWAVICAILLSSILIYCWLIKKNKYSWIALALMIGWVFSAGYAHMSLSPSITKDMETHAIHLRGIVATPPNMDANGSNFEFVATNGLRLRLTWRKPTQTLRVGDEWWFTARLKRIHGSASPGAFDFEAWALQRGLRGTAYVLAQGNQLLGHRWYRYPINQLREYIELRILQYLPNSRTAHWLPALMVGERQNIPPEQWQVLRNTGTNHLMAIAGLHIGLLTMFVYTLANAIWRRSYYLMLWRPAKDGALIIALIAAVLYSALAGFSIPTQRAFIMLMLFSVAVIARKQIPAWHVWSLTLLAVLLLNPLDVLTESFWLSFGTIALIIYGMDGRLLPTGWWWKYGRVQWIIGFGLIPFSLLFFQECSLVSFLANMIAIPWLSFFILPLCWLSAIFLFVIPPLGASLLVLADKSLAGLWCVLMWLANHSFAIWPHAVPNYYVFITMLMAFLLLLLPNGVPGRWLGIIWGAPLFLAMPAKPAIGDIWITMLDVGQGLSVFVQTKQHTLLYDAGAKYKNADMGERVILPYLRILNMHKIDKLVISHGDNDHIGGVPALLNNIKVHSIYTSVPEKLAIPAAYCLSKQHWRWDGVDFAFIYPGENELYLGNDSSCVLRITNGEQVILLTGDIEKFAEKKLLQVPTYLKADAIVVPHHGSKTSALPAFIQTVYPRWVLYSTGYLNRYHFPHTQVVTGYSAIHAQQFNSAETGTLQVQFNRGKKPFFSAYRFTHARYWMTR